MIANCGVYKIMNIVNGNFYIGSSCDLRGRLWGHRNMLSRATHHNPHLQSAWNKYGSDNFVFETILLCDAASKLYYEQALIDGLKPTYNIAKDTSAPWQGRHHTEETKRKLSEAHKGKHLSEETKRKIGEAHIGKGYALGHTVTEETKRRLRETSTGNTNSLGYKHTTETRMNMSEAHKGHTNCLGYKHTNEARQHMSEAHIGKNLGELNHMFGKHHTEDAKRKISEDKKRWWAQQKELNNGGI